MNEGSVAVVPAASRDIASTISGIVGQWLVAGAVVWLSLAGLTFNRWEPYLFRRSYQSSLGHFVAGQLTRAANSSMPACLLVGLSTTYADLDPELLEHAVPRYRFIQASSAGGSIYGVELILAMAEDQGVKPACIVLGLHTHLLKDRMLALAPAGYLDVLSPRTQIAFIPREVAAERTRALIEAERRAAWPAFRVAQQLSRLTRDGLFRMQRRWSWRSALPREEFEHAAGDLLATDEYLGEVQRMTPEAQKNFYQGMEEERLLDPSTYGSPEHVASLKRVLSRSLLLAPVVVAVYLPESRYGRELVSALADEPFQKVMRQATSPRLTVIDDRALCRDEEFDVAFHLVHDAAARYSADFGRRLARVLDR